jgi:CDP-diacylglycerol--glycerol-3-phosphate 3-phosphatidyltransferase
MPNKLTVSRFVLTVLFLLAMFSRSPLNDTLALLFFCVASLTDYLDGRIARRRGLITNFGTLMDPLADKILTCSAFIAFVERCRLNPVSPVTVEAWVVIIIVARELAITGLRLLAAAKNVVLAAYVEWWPWLQGALRWWVPTFAQIALWVTVTLTATSGALYLWRNRALYLSDL